MAAGRTCVVCSGSMLGRSVNAKICANAECRRAMDAQKSRRWREENPERAKEVVRLNRLKDPERHNARKRRWRKENPEKYAREKEQYVARNIDLIRDRNRLRAAKQRAAMRAVRELGIQI